LVGFNETKWDETMGEFVGMLAAQIFSPAVSPIVNIVISFWEHTKRAVPQGETVESVESLDWDWGSNFWGSKLVVSHLDTKSRLGSELFSESKLEAGKVIFQLIEASLDEVNK